MEKEQDLKFGNLNEDYIKDEIQKYWNITDLKKLDVFNIFDFYSKDADIHFEIKARRNTHNKYNTTMVGYNKIQYAIKLNKKVIFIFIFEDGNYYYEYDKNDEFKTTMGGRCDRGKDEYKLYYYIPINKLKRM
jgi:hypothetical protein